MRVLVVDDDPLILETVTEMLLRSGHIVARAVNGLQALSRLADGKFDLVIADIFMPGGTGLELLMWMRAKGIELPFICISGGDGDYFEPYATTMASLGAVSVLRKPFEPAQLSLALANANFGGTSTS